MLIDIYCLKGDPHKMEQAEIVGTLIRKQVFKFDDILELITNIYQDVNTPFPYIGNVEANSKGLIIPSVGNFFFWVILSKTSDVIVLDDFGASLTSNRITVLNKMCERAASDRNSIWQFADKWQMSHHKTSIERLVSYYVYYVVNHFNAKDYRSWLMADGYFVQAPFDENLNKYHYTGIDMSILNNTALLSGKLETAIFNSDQANRINPLTQRKIRAFVKDYLKIKKINPATEVSEDGSGRKSGNVISLSRFESLKNDVIQGFSNK